MVSASRIAFLTSLCRQQPNLASRRNLYNRQTLFKLFTFSTVTTNLLHSTKSTQMETSSSFYDTGYLNARDAASLDADLMSQPGYSLEQLMELAGLSVAEAAYAVLPPRSKILVIAGPGNNGGDGLVAARHLTLFGHNCRVVYPKPSKKAHFVNLVKQCVDAGVDVIREFPSGEEEEGADAIIDAIFGFSFSGDPREPFASALTAMMRMQKEGSMVISVDIPSGWDVDEGDVKGTGFVPDVLVSLTAPKLSAKGFLGRHFVGGRFLPNDIGKKYNVKMPPYPGVSQVMEIPRGGGGKGPGAEEWAIQYAEYCAEKERDLRKNDQSTGVGVEGSTSSMGGAQSWEAGYAEYCAEKEKEFFDKNFPEKDKNKDN